MKDIQVIDNFLNASHLQKIYNTVIRSFYKIGWEDSSEFQHRAYPNLHSAYDFKDVKNLKILDPLLKVVKEKNLTIDNYHSCMINLTKPLDVNFTHIHVDSVVAILYCNLTWNPEWGGETIFYENNRKEILFSSPYTPNRLIVFEGRIPHTIKAQNFLGPSYRFTLSVFFDKIHLIKEN